MTRDELDRYLNLSYSRTVLVDIAYPEPYPGWMRFVLLRRPARVEIAFEACNSSGSSRWLGRHGNGGGGMPNEEWFSCTADYDDVDLAVDAVEEYLGKPIDQWTNYNRTGFELRRSRPDAAVGARLIADLKAGTLPLPTRSPKNGSTFTAAGPLLEAEDDIDYFQPRVMRHLTLDGEVEYAIHDVYFNRRGEVVLWTDAARSDRASSVAALKQKILDLVQSGVDEAVCGDIGYAHLRSHFEHWLEHIDDDVIPYEDPEAGP